MQTAPSALPLFTRCRLLSTTAIAFLSLHIYAQELETVIVSGSKQETRLSDSVVSISVVDADKLAAANADHPSELFASVPGVWISRGGSGQEHLSALRSPVFTGSGACAAFVVAQDSIPVRGPGFCNVNQLADTFFELADRVEVYRGPASSVFGGDALFGAINVLSPTANDPQYLSGEIGAHDFARLKFHLSSRDKTEQVFASLSSDGGWRQHSAYQLQKIGVGRDDTFGHWNSSSTLLIDRLQQDSAGYIEGPDAYLNTEISKTNPNPNAYRNSLAIRFTNRFSHELSDTSSLIINPYLRFDKMDFLMHFVPWQAREENGHQSVGVQSQIQFESTTVHQSIGLEADISSGYLREIQDRDFHLDIFPPGKHYDFTVLSQQTAASYSLDWNIRPDFLVDLRARLERLSYRYNNLLDDGYACEPGVENCRFYRPADRSDSFSSPSWRLGVNYSLSSASRLYANTGRAFRSPQAVEMYRLQAPQEFSHFRNTHLQGSEIGWRIEKKKIYAQLDAFDMHLRDGVYQNTQREYLTGASSSHRGVEFETTATLTSQFTLSASLSRARHRYQNSPQSLGINSYIEGLDIDTAPHTLYAIMPKWHLSRKWSLAANYSYLGPYFLNPENTAVYPGHHLLDLTISRSDTRWSAQLFIRNLLDTRYAERADYAFGRYRYFPGEERNIEFRLERKMGLAVHGGSL